MKPEAIFAPVCVLVLWTGFVVLLTGVRRVLAVRAGRVTAHAFKLGESSDVPPDVAVFNRNFMNLLEMPVLFYVGCLAFYVTRRVDSVVLLLAWLYVALRLAHSLVHLGPNLIVLRLAAFAASNFVLLAIWIRFMAAVL
jgi:hypothetical protein